jgi:hypothetical protein
MAINKEDWIILYLSLQLIVLSGLLVKAEYRIGFLEGQLHEQQLIQDAVNDAVGH